MDAIHIEKEEWIQSFLSFSHPEIVLQLNNRIFSN